MIQTWVQTLCQLLGNSVSHQLSTFLTEDSNQKQRLGPSLWGFLRVQRTNCIFLPQPRIPGPAETLGAGGRQGNSALLWEQG